MNKNLVQNICIIVLIFTSLLLLSIRFELLFFVKNQNSNVVIDKSKIEYLARPNSIIVRFGNENTRKIFDKNGIYYRDVAKVLKMSLSSINEIKEIDAVEYKSKKTLKGIQLNFSPEINQRLLYGSLFLTEGSIGDFVEISEIVIPQADTGSLYFYADEKYYEIKNQNKSMLINYEKFNDFGVSNYYSLLERFPELTDNDVLIAEEIRLNEINTIATFGEDNIDILGRSILGNKYDFSNRLYNTDGSSVIDYDYGKETVKIMPDGKVFYSNIISDEKVKMDEIEASSIAIDFVSKVLKDNATITIESIDKFDKDGILSYEIYISQRYDGIRLSNKKDESTIKVVVENKKVKSMEGIFVNIIKEEEKSLVFSENAVLYILEKNYDYIKSKEPFKDTRDLLNKIKNAEYGYVYDDNGDFLACYKIIIGNNIFFFNIENAEVIA